MSRAVRMRLIAFVVLSAVGVVYFASSYLGLIDKLLDRGLTLHATLPRSGGLFEGSEVTYRGVKVGEVSRMNVIDDGISLDLALVEGTEIPVDSPMYVHNLSAVGEQYLDFEPVDDDGPYYQDGDTAAGDLESLPVDEGDLLVTIDAFVNSVGKRDLQTVVRELGLAFRDTGVPLQRLLDNGGRFIRVAHAHTDDTIRLLRTGLTVLDTQQDNGENIRAFSRDLRLLTAALRASDADLRGVLRGTPGTARELQRLLEDLEPTLPVLLGNAISINQVMVSHLAGVEQLLVTFPRTIAGGFTGTPPDGYGHVNLQYDNDVPPCTNGYKPPSRWRQPNNLSDGPIFPAECESGAPYVMRGSKWVPGGEYRSPPRSYGASYDPRTGVVSGVVDRHGRPVRLVDPGDLSLFGESSWKWLLVGPVASR